MEKNLVIHSDQIIIYSFNHKEVIQKYQPSFKKQQLAFLFVFRVTHFFQISLFFELRWMIDTLGWFWSR